MHGGVIWAEYRLSVPVFWLQSILLVCFLLLFFIFLPKKGQFNAYFDKKNKINMVLLPMSMQQSMQLHRSK